MWTLDLPYLLGIMVCLANSKVKMKDLQQFDNWLHIISLHVVVKVCDGGTIIERKNFKDQLVKLLQFNYNLILKSKHNSLMLFKNYVNIHV